MAVGEEKELKHFEQDAEEGGGDKHAEGEADKTVFRCFGSPVGRSERTPDEEQNESKSGKHGHVPEVGILVSPFTEPTRDPPHLAHVRRRRESAGQNRQQETCGEEPGDRCQEAAGRQGKQISHGVRWLVAAATYLRPGGLRFSRTVFRWGGGQPSSAVRLQVREV
jgi:hypothetical protein